MQLRELWKWMRVRKRWWLTPIVVILGLFGAFIVATEGSVAMPFIYTLF